MGYWHWHCSGSAAAVAVSAQPQAAVHVCRPQQLLTSNKNKHITMPLRLQITGLSSISCQPLIKPLNHSKVANSRSTCSLFQVLVYLWGQSKSIEPTENFDKTRSVGPMAVSRVFFVLQFIYGVNEQKYSQWRAATGTKFEQIIFQKTTLIVVFVIVFHLLFSEQVPCSPWLCSTTGLHEWPGHDIHVLGLSWWSVGVGVFNCSSLIVAYII